MTNNRFTYFLLHEGEGCCSEGWGTVAQAVHMAEDFADNIGAPVEEIIVVQKIGTLETTTVVKFVED